MADYPKTAQDQQRKEGKGTTWQDHTEFSWEPKLSGQQWKDRQSGRAEGPYQRNAQRLSQYMDGPLGRDKKTTRWKERGKVSPDSRSPVKGKPNSKQAFQWGINEGREDSKNQQKRRREEYGPSQTRQLAETDWKARKKGTGTNETPTEQRFLGNQQRQQIQELKGKVR